MFALIDVMKSSYHHISTVGIGAVMSAGFLIFASGLQGYRYIGKNTGIMNHQHSDNLDAKMHDIRAQMKENPKLRSKMLTNFKRSNRYDCTRSKKQVYKKSHQINITQPAIG